MKKIILALGFVLAAGAAYGQSFPMGGGGSGSSGCTGSTAATASLCVQRDTNANGFANSFVANGQTVVTSASPVTLTVASPPNLVLTGSTAQTVNLPDATTLTANQSSQFRINNNSSATTTIKDAAGGTVYTALAGSDVRINLLTGATAAGTWDVHPNAPSIVSWGSGAGGLQLNNALNTTAQVASGASSCTAPNFVPQRANSTTGFGSSASTNICGAAAGTTTFTSTATTFNIPSGANYQINGAQIAASNLSNGTTGSGSVVLATSPTLVTPALGTPSSGTLTNATGLPYTGVTRSPQFLGTRITSTQSLSTGTPAKVQLNNIAIDSGSYWDGANFYYKPLVAGTYLACGSVLVTGTALTYVEAAISKNGTTGSGGTEISDVEQVGMSASAWSVTVPCSLVAMNGSTDTLELDITATGTSPVVAFVRSTTQMTIKWVSP